MTRTEQARAKINLFLHVGRPAPDGYHDLLSLMVFADIGDRVTPRPEGSGFAVTGRFASGLTHENDNLVTRARDRFEARFGQASDFGLTLEKTLPIASGLGGGSADAAATLRLLAAESDLPEPQRLESGALGEIARSLGADVAACLGSVPVMARGRGDVLASAPPLPVLHAVLVNPGARSSTAAVYRAFDEAAVFGDLVTTAPGSLATAAQVARWLTTTRNDLEAPAIGLCPEIGEVIALLRRSDGCLLARMSGSGATCFALCPGEAEASSLARTVRSARPDWWVASCLLGGGAI